MQGTHRIDGEGLIHIAGQDSEGKNRDILHQAPQRVPQVDAGCAILPTGA
jgi:hypothetical protein